MNFLNLKKAKELEDTKEDFKTQRLINMEMKDYERSVNELKKTVESAQEEAESYKKGKTVTVTNSP